MMFQHSSATPTLDTAELQLAVEMVFICGENSKSKEFHFLSSQKLLYHDQLLLHCPHPALRHSSTPHDSPRNHQIASIGTPHDSPADFPLTECAFDRTISFNSNSTHSNFHAHDSIKQYTPPPPSPTSFSCFHFDLNSVTQTTAVPPNHHRVCFSGFGPFFILLHPTYLSLVNLIFSNLSSINAALPMLY